MKNKKKILLGVGTICGSIIGYALYKNNKSTKDDINNIKQTIKDIYDKFDGLNDDLDLLDSALLNHGIDVNDSWHYSEIRN